MARESIVEKLNSEPEILEIKFTQAEVQYMLERYIHTHSKKKVTKSKLHHYVGKSNTERIGFKVMLK